ncbi:ATP-grasp domain-containing protein [Candidatus Peregrinibacteria bacterium]|jgi:hypothetical protein|nr:ATP-grasp domain-containing protein [Candidatus Peregrinibacteria bacterium]
MDNILNKHLIVFVAKDFTRGLGLEEILPNFAIVCGYNSPALTKLKEKGTNILVTDLPNSGKILESEETVQYINDLKKELNCQEVSILCFKGDSKREFNCKKNGWNFLNLDATTTNYLESKINFQTLTEEIEIPLLPTLSGKMKDLNPTGLSENLVLQYTHGFAGNSTIFTTQEEFLKLQSKSPERKVKITPFIEGQTLTLNGCIYQDKIFLSHPFTQKTGNLKFTRYQGGSYGVIFDSDEFPSHLLDQTLHSSYELTKAFKRHGLRGFFGIDLITDGKTVYPIELNPRLTANIHPFTTQQAHNHLPPFIFLHILEFLNLPIPTPAWKDYLHPLKGETTVYRNLGDTPIKITEKSTSPHYSFSDLLTNPSLKEITITPGKDSEVLPDGKLKEIWRI